jgi:hypothetical protein
MMKCIMLVACVAVATPALAQSSHYVRGYTTKNGTYVAPHYQTNPDSSLLNNWSTKGNYNPYTGKPGTVNPYGSSSRSTYGSSSYGSSSYGYTQPSLGYGTKDSGSDDDDPQ